MAQFESADGLLLLFERDQAKHLFAAKGDEVLSAFLNEFISSADTEILTFGGDWNVVHAAFCRGDSTPGGGEPPLNQCVLGGRPLTSNEETMIVRLVRPDVVQHIAAAADELVIDSLKEYFDVGEASGLDWNTGQQLIGKVLNHYRMAAQKRAAVAFFVTL